MHGSTLSMTRLLCTAEILKRFDSKKEVYGVQDLVNLQLGMLTIVGMVEGRHVFSANVVQNNLRRAVFGVPPFDPIAANVSDLCI
jgi:hypothetical protein